MILRLMSGEQCSATCEVSSLLFTCPYTCGSVTAACVGEDGAAPDTPEVVLEKVPSEGS